MPRPKDDAHQGSTPATAALAAAKINFSTHAYAHGTDPHNFGEEAAAALGVDPQRMFKTLVAQVDEQLAVAVLPVADRLDVKALAKAVGGKKAQLADAQDATRSTGYVVGGISPIAQRKALFTVLDASAQDFATIFVSAGKRGLQIELAPQSLIWMTSAVVAGIVAPSSTSWSR